MTPSISIPDPRRWWALLLLCTAQFLVILDTSIVGIALPSLQRALGFDAAGLQWIFNAYVVAFGGLLLLGGRLADLFGPRRLLAGFFQPLAACVVMAAAIYGVREAVLAAGWFHPAALLAAMIGTGAVTYVLAALVICRETARDLISLVRKALSRG